MSQLKSQQVINKVSGCNSKEGEDQAWHCRNPKCHSAIKIESGGTKAPHPIPMLCNEHGDPNGLTPACVGCWYTRLLR